MKDYGELSRDRHLCFSIAPTPGDAQPPALQSGELWDTRQQRIGCLIEAASKKVIAPFRHAPGSHRLTGVNRAGLAGDPNS